MPSGRGQTPGRPLPPQGSPHIFAYERAIGKLLSVEARKEMEDSVANAPSAAYAKAARADLDAADAKTLARLVAAIKKEERK